MAKHGRFISVANMKGGVGKTTTVVSLAESLCASDPNVAVLVVDLDPQASASLCLAGDDVLAQLIERGRTLQDFLELRLIAQKKTRPIGEYLRRHFSFTIHQGRPLNIALFACGSQLRLLEREIIYALTNKKFSMSAIEGHLWKLFQAEFLPLRKEFDFVIFDCPPGISPFAEVAIRASDLIVIPTIPDRISNFGLQAFCASLQNSDYTSLPKPALPHVLISRLQHTLKQHKELLQRLEAETEEEDASFSLLKTRIPQSAALASALSTNTIQPFTKKYTPDVVPILASLAQEIQELAHAHRR